MATPREPEPDEITAEEAARMGLVALEPETGEPPADGDDVVAPPVEPVDPGLLSPRTRLGATAAGVSQGATLGFGDEVLGLSGALDEFGRRARQKVGLEVPAPTDLDPAIIRSTPRVTSTFGLARPATSREVAPAEVPEPERLAKIYRRIRDTERADLETAEREHPGFYAAGELAGGLAVPAPGGAAVKGVGLARRAARGMGTAAVVGAGYGLGKSTEREPGGMTADAAIGGAIAAPFGAGGAALGHGAAKLKNYFGDKAGERAVQAAGTRAGITDRLAKEGIGLDEAPELGNRMLDEGLIPSGLNPFRNPQEQTLARSLALKESAGKRVGQSVSDFDANTARLADIEARAIERAQTAPKGFAETVATANARKAIQDRAASTVDVDRVKAAAGKTLEGLDLQTSRAAGPAAALLEDIGATGASMAEQQALKRGAARGTNFSTEAPAAPRIKRQVGGAHRAALEDELGRTLGPEALSKFRAANQSFSTAADAEKIARNALSRGLQQQQFGTLRGAIGSGLTAAGIGGATMGLEGLGAAPLGVAINAAINARGPNVAAHVNRMLSMAAEDPTAAAALQSLATQLGVQVADIARAMARPERQSLTQQFGGKGAL